MKQLQKTISLIIIAIFSTSAMAEVNVGISPLGIIVNIPEEDQFVETTILIENAGENTIRYETDLTEPNEARMGRGPVRDDPGDVVDYFEYRDQFWCGLAWNGDEIVAADYDNRRIHFWNINDEDFVEDIEVDYSPWGIAFDGENYWVATDDPNRLRQIDREGNQIETINLDYIPSGVAWDGENLWTHPYNGDFIMRRISIEGEELSEFDCRNIRGADSYALTWVPQHDEGHIWTMSETGTLRQFDLDFENEEIEVVQELDLGIVGGTYGITHDGENLWISNYNVERENLPWGWWVIDDGIAEPRWVSVEPESGDLASGEEMDFIVTFDVTGLQDGTYHMLLEIELTEVDEDDNILDSDQVEMSLVVSTGVPVVDVFGVVTDPAENNEAMLGVEASIDQYLIRRYSDEDGSFSFTDLPSGDYEMTFTAEDYLPMVEAIELGDEDIELNIGLLHSEFDSEVDEITRILDLGQQADLPFEVTNAGNGPLTWSVDRRLIGDANVEPFTLRGEVMVGEINDDTSIRGVVFVRGIREGRFYISGSHDGEPVIYVHNEDGEFIENFDQPGNDRNGMRDLAYDGELIWGPAGNRIYGMTLAGEVVADFDAAFHPTNSIAYDSDREILWICNPTTDLIGIDREGNPIDGAEYDLQGLRIYGLAYWQDDPDGHNLYLYNMFDDDEGRRPALHKLNLETDEIRFVTWLETERGGTALGAFITRQYDYYSTVMLTVVSASANAGGDRIDIWQLDTNLEWMQIEPTEGVIQAEESQDFTLTLDTEDLFEVTFEGELAFTHDGIGGETIIPITLEVIGGPPARPSPFNLLSPEDETSLWAPDVITFVWDQSFDPIWEEVVSYNIMIQANEGIYSLATGDTTIEISIDELSDSLDLDLADNVNMEWWVWAIVGVDSIESNERFSLSLVMDNIDQGDPSIPLEFSIQSAYPNPFNSQIKIQFGLDVGSTPIMRLYDLSGRLIRERSLIYLSAGYHVMTVNGQNLSAGIYLMELETRGEIKRRKLTLVK